MQHLTDSNNVGQIQSRWNKRSIQGQLLLCTSTAGIDCKHQFAVSGDILVPPQPGKSLDSNQRGIRMHLSSSVILAAMMSSKCLSELCDRVSDTHPADSPVALLWNGNNLFICTEAISILFCSAQLISNNTVSMFYCSSKGGRLINHFN